MAQKNGVKEKDQTINQITIYPVLLNPMIGVIFDNSLEKK